uniref:Uncharacterized protein n=1 Tax=Megaselia scalaris TaxID=36166 RepID=T1GSE9_MEGSC
MRPLKGQKRLWRTRNFKLLSDVPTPVHKRFQKPSISASIRVVANEKQVNDKLRLVLADTSHEGGKISNDTEWRIEGLVLDLLVGFSETYIFFDGDGLIVTVFSTVQIRSQLSSS